MFENVESGTLQRMIQLVREDWRSTGRALPFLLYESGDYEETRSLLRQVITHSYRRKLMRFACSKTSCVLRPN